MAEWGEMEARLVRLRRGLSGRARDTGFYPKTVVVSRRFAESYIAYLEDRDLKTWDGFPASRTVGPHGGPFFKGVELVLLGSC